MITQESAIQIDEDGTTLPIQELSISNLIYDPKMRQQVEISDLLSRECIPGIEGYPTEMAPIYFPKHCFSDKIPTIGTWLSPYQPVLADPNPRATAGNLTECSALELWKEAGAIKIRDENALVYYAVFCDRPQWMVVNGLPVKTFDPSVFEVRTAPSPRVRIH